MHSNVTENGQKIFIYRNVNGWTNISLESTESAPKLTCDPITTLFTAYREFTNCAAVSKVTIKWAGSAAELGVDDIKGMETQFDPLPEPVAEESGASSSKTDAEVLYDVIGAMDKKIDDVSTKLEEVNVKLVHIVSTQGGPGSSGGGGGGGGRTDQTAAKQWRRGQRPPCRPPRAVGDGDEKSCEKHAALYVFGVKSPSFPSPPPVRRSPPPGGFAERMATCTCCTRVGHVYRCCTRVQPTLKVRTAIPAAPPKQGPL